MLLTGILEEEENLFFSSSPGEERVIPKIDPVPASSCHVSPTVKKKVFYEDTEMSSYSCAT